MKPILWQVGDLTIKVRPSDEIMLRLWELLFEQGKARNTTVPDLILDISQSNALTTPTAGYDFYDGDVGFGVTKDQHRLLFYFDAGGMALLDLEKKRIEFCYHPASLTELESMLYLTLSPLLRRKNHCLLHAFAVQHGNETLLLVGDSMSGKTTAGTVLLQDGGRFLSNDTAVLSLHENMILSHPTLDWIRVRPQTAMMLNLSQPNHHSNFRYAHYGFKAGKVGRVTAVYFLTLAPDQPTEIRPLSKAVALAKLMEASVDRWDGETLGMQTKFLRRLCEETAVYTLQSGQNITQLPHLLPRHTK